MSTTTLATNPFHAAIEKYARAPIAFVRDILGQEPDSWQLEALRAVARGHTRLAIRSGHGVGKAMSLSSVVPTPDGDRVWGDLRPGDRLFGSNGEATHIVSRHDQGVRPMFRVTFDDGTSCRVDGEHLWAVRGRKERRKYGSAGIYTALTTAEIVARGVKRPNGVSMARQWELPLHCPVQYPSRDVPIPPYFVGAALADGSLTRQSTFQMSGSVAKLAHWQSLATHAGLRSRAWRDTTRSQDVGHITLYGQTAFLRELNMSGQRGEDRFVPPLYKENTPAARLGVLQGLMDADGYADARGIAVYTTVSFHLAEDVAWLVRSLGGKAFIGTPQPSHYKNPEGERIRTKDHYDVTVRLPPGMDLFTLPSKAKRQRPCQPRYLVRWIDSIEPDGEEEAMCVKVDAGDSLYLANDFIVTHNTCFAAWLCVWFICTRAPFKVAITAPSSSQLFDALWPEFIKWLNILPSGWRDLWDIRSDRVTLKADQECFVTARTSRPDTPEAMAGLHSAHILLVADEASGIPEAVFEAASGSMSSHGAITLLIGNATRSTGFFYRAHMMERDRWFTLKVSSASSKRVTSEFTEEIANRYGMDSNAFRVRVLGEFPLADDNTLIGADVVDSAMLRDIEIDPLAIEIWGVDVARFGTDASVLVKRKGRVVTEMPRAWHGLDTMQLAGAIKAEWDTASPASRPSLICIDVIGIGSGVVDRLHEQNLPILGVNVSETASTTGRYARLRDELWVRCKEWLGNRNVRLPRHDRLRDDLLMPRYSFLSDGRLQVESKQSMRSRGLPSCDHADALNLTFCEQGLGVGSGMTSGLFDKTPVHMSLADGDLV